MKHKVVFDVGRIPAAGMMSTLMFGICVLLGQFTAKGELWKEVSNIQSIIGWFIWQKYLGGCE